LRVARPAGTALGDRLPVVVHLHGGGVVKGSAYDPHFDPEKLITLSKELYKPIIYVALNYRITIFGFARLPILKEQKSNVGMRDQYFSHVVITHSRIRRSQKQHGMRHVQERVTCYIPNRQTERLLLHTRSGMERLQEVHCTF
jgi:hypothetical protein